MFAFILFLILGLAVFVPLGGGGRMVALVIFTVLMVVWLLQGVGAFPPLRFGAW